MKKLLVVLLSLTLIFAFTGCTSSNNEAAEDIEIKTQEVVTSNTDDDDDNISNTENAVENVNEKDYDFSSYENNIRNITKSVSILKFIIKFIQFVINCVYLFFQSVELFVIEKLEDELELAEEALENKYGIDD